MLTPESIVHPKLGPLIFDEKREQWKGKIGKPPVRIGINSIPNAGSNIKNVLRFIDWYENNLKTINKNIVYEIFNHDMVHGEVYIENASALTSEEYEREHVILMSKVERSLVLKEIRSFDEKISVWINAGKYTGDHDIKTVFNEKYEISQMWLM